MELGVLLCPENDFTIFGKRISVRLFVREKKFVASATQEIMHKIS